MSYCTLKVNFMHKALAWNSTSHLIKTQKRKVLEKFINLWDDFLTKNIFLENVRFGKVYF